MYVPPALGFGSRGFPGLVPPDAALILWLNVEGRVLESIKKKSGGLMERVGGTVGVAEEGGPETKSGARREESDAESRASEESD